LRQQILNAGGQNHYLPENWVLPSRPPIHGSPTSGQSRNTVIIRLSRLGWPQDKIAKTIGVTRGRIAQIINNTNYGKINTLLSQGHDMEYIARHYNMDLPLVWALRLKGKKDQEKFI